MHFMITTWLLATESNFLIKSNIKNYVLLAKQVAICKWILNLQVKPTFIKIYLFENIETLRVEPVENWYVWVY